MNKKEVLELISFINKNYHNYFDNKKIDGIVEEWYKDLCQYDFEDVKEQTKELMSKSDFQMKPPTLYHIISRCQKKYEKVDYSRITYFCDNCNKIFKDYDELLEHRTKENSMEYIIRETKKWFNKDLDKDQLFKMEEKEFEERYNKLLHYIYENTTDEEEKTRIGYIFNPPGQEEALAFLNKDK